MTGQQNFRQGKIESLADDKSNGTQMINSGSKKRKGGWGGGAEGENAVDQIRIPYSYVIWSCSPDFFFSRNI